MSTTTDARISQRLSSCGSMAGFGALFAPVCAPVLIDHRHCAGIEIDQHACSERLFKLNRHRSHLSNSRDHGMRTKWLPVLNRRKDYKRGLRFDHLSRRIVGSTFGCADEPKVECAIIRSDRCCASTMRLPVERSGSPGRVWRHPLTLCEIWFKHPNRPDRVVAFELPGRQLSWTSISEEVRFGEVRISDHQTSAFGEIRRALHVSRAEQCKDTEWDGRVTIDCSREKCQLRGTGAKSLVHLRFRTDEHERTGFCRDRELGPALKCPTSPFTVLICLHYSRRPDAGSLNYQCTR